jgi:multiple sugar transport system ATP-binding protein
MASVHWDRVHKEFEDGTVAVEDFSLDVADGEFVVLVGPSGSGKSTALRLAAGLEETSAGTIVIGERDVTELAPRDRDIAMVFQTYALYPHMSVADNLGFALRMRGTPRVEIEARTQDVSQRLGIDQLLRRRPAQLSGGQRQRVALGRAMVRDPQAFFMDEPLSNLDAQLRVEMRAYISKLQTELGTTTVFVTHDQVEAMTMGDRVAVMRDGRLEQVAAPQELYDRPANAFVASFIGSPSMNLLHARLEIEGTDLVAVVGAGRLRLDDSMLESAPAIAGRAGEQVILGIRPEAIGRPHSGATERTLEGRVLLAESLGSDVIAHVELDAPRVLTGESVDVVSELGGAGDAREEIVAVDRARITARLPLVDAPRTGEVARLEVATDHLHFFDPASGLAIGSAGDLAGSPAA